MKSTGRGLEKGGRLEFLEDKGTKLSGTFCIHVGGTFRPWLQAYLYDKKYILK